VAAVVSGAALAALAWGGPVAAVFAGTYSWLAVRAAVDRRAARSAERGAVVVEDLVTGLAADLRAGLPPATALEGGIRTVLVTGEWPPGVTSPPAPAAIRDPGGPPPALVGTRGAGGPLPAPAATRGLARSRPALATPAGPFAAVLAAAAGGDVPAALREIEVPGGRDALTRLAACWEVADSSGAPLADVLDRLDAELAALRRRRARMRAETAAAAATVRMLAVLPLLGMGLGYALGADPLDTLLHSAVGNASALVALALQVSGLLWAERLAAPPERHPP
jgi:tight adherence protein B